MPTSLAVLLAVALIGAFAWTLVMPPLQGPDEVGHFSYTQKIVAAGEIPWRVVGGAPEPGTPPVSTEVGRALIAAAILPSWANLSARPASTKLEGRRWSRAQQTVTSTEQADGGFTSSMENPPAYYLYQAAPYAVTTQASVFTRALVMRLANLPLLVVVVVFTWLVAGELLGRVRWLQTVATAAVVLQPQLMHLTATVNPDIALAAIWAAALYVMIRAIKAGLSRGRLAWLAALVALSALTQPRGLALVIPAVAAVALAVRRHAPVRALRRRAVPIGLAVAGVCGVVLLVGYAMAGDPSEARLRQFGSYVWQFYLPKLGFMDPSISPEWSVNDAFVTRLFGGFAQLEIGPPDWVVTALTMGAVALIALALVGVAARRRALARWPDLAAVCALMVVGYVFVLHVAAFRALLSAPDPIITGRYLLTLIPLYGVGIALAVSWLPRRLAVPTASVVLVALTVLALASFALLFERFYA